MRLEPMLWDLLMDIVRREGTSLNALVSSLERRMEPQVADDLNLTATVRLFVLWYLKAATTEEGHRQAGHGQGNPFDGLDLTPRDKDERRRGRKPKGNALSTFGLAA